MKATRPLIALLLFVSTAALFVSFDRYRAAVRLNRVLAETQSELKAAHAKMAALEGARSRDVPTSPAVLTAQGAVPNTARDTSSETPTEKIQHEKPTVEGAIDRIVPHHSELQSLYVRQQTIRFPQRFGLLYASLGLSPAQVAEFERAMEENAQAVIDVSVSALGQGIAKEDSAAQTLIRQAREERDRKLQILLGDSGFQEFLSHERNAARKGASDLLAQNLYYTANPLTQATAIEFDRLVSANLARNGAVNWPELIQESGRILTPIQLKVLERQNDMITTGQRVHDNLKKAGVTKDEPKS